MGNLDNFTLYMEDLKEQDEILKRNQRVIKDKSRKQIAKRKW
jgi:hypothetical protein